MMPFQLWEADSANLVGSYPTREAALAIVRDAVQKHGREGVASLVLVREDARGRVTTVGEGDALVELALPQTAPLT
jgi:hypothetical protein